MSRTKLGLGLGLEMHKTNNRRDRRPCRRRSRRKRERETQLLDIVLRLSVLEPCILYVKPNCIMLGLHSRQRSSEFFQQICVAAVCHIVLAEFNFLTAGTVNGPLRHNIANFMKIS